MKGTIALFAIATLAAGSLIANGQDYTSNVTLPGMSGVTTYNSVPQGFDPVYASQEQLQDYGFPRRPDPNDVKPYSRWLQAVATTRITPELVVNPGRYHLPNQQIGKSVVEGNTTKVTSGNWSGWSLLGGSPKLYEVYGLWVVPSVNNQFSKISGYMSEWIGIDGNCKCNDLIQDGTEQQWTGGKPAYYAWIEFIPNAEVEIPNFQVSPGDVIYAYSAVGTKNNVVTGFYYLEHFSYRCIS